MFCKKQKNIRSSILRKDKGKFITKILKRQIHESEFSMLVIIELVKKKADIIMFRGIVRVPQV